MSIKVDQQGLIANRKILITGGAGFITNKFQTTTFQTANNVSRTSNLNFGDAGVYGELVEPVGWRFVLGAELVRRIEAP